MNGLVGATAPAYTEEERRNIELIRALRAAPFAERGAFLHPRLRHHRRGFHGLGELTGQTYAADSIADRVDTIEDIVAKGDRVWAVWTLRGTHTGPLYGIPATGRQLAVLEMGIWRIEDGLVAECWFFADELALLRQLELRDLPG